MPRTEEQLVELREERRAQIRAAAVRVFADKGFDQAQMSDIAREAGLGRGTVYWYFPSKHELFHDVVSAELAALAELARVADVPGESPVALFTGAMRTLFDRVREEPHSARLLMRILVDDTVAKHVRAEAAEVLRESRRAVVKLLERLRDAGVVPPFVDLSTLATLLLALGDGLLIHHMLDPEGVSLDRVEAFLTSMTALLPVLMSGGGEAR